ncbi:pyridoxal-phosphate dependent enzyme, partial [Acinetobacter baumannii]|uniref:pyridoxal-phosphate dependent enzyme n=1 Tax=Acinetobacter baumannii TaxID=470 RepID=UPI001F0A16A7
MFGFEAEGAAALVKGEPIEQPETLATAIRIGNPASWDLALNARDESEGHIDYVTDDEIVEAYRKLAASEGIFAEPASAASL